MSDMTKDDRPKSRRRDTLSALRSDVEKLADRLDTADMATRRGVQALEVALHALQKRVGSSPADAQALQSQIQALSDKLNKRMQATRIALATDLQSVIDNPNIETLKSALMIAETRLSENEKTHAEALARINHHLARLARDIDARIDHEIKTREVQNLDLSNRLDRVEANIGPTSLELSEKIEALENDNAAAITKLGDKVVDLSMKLNAQSNNNQQVTQDKIIEIAAATQDEFKIYKDRIDEKIEGLKIAHRNQDATFEQSLLAIKARLETLEYGIVSANPSHSGSHNAHTAPASFLPPVQPIQDAFSPQVPNTAELSPHNITHGHAPSGNTPSTLDNLHQDGSYAGEITNTPHLTDPNTANETANSEPNIKPGSELGEDEGAANIAAPSGPIEFDPAKHMPTPSASTAPANAPMAPAYPHEHLSAHEYQAATPQWAPPAPEQSGLTHPQTLAQTQAHLEAQGTGQQTLGSIPSDLALPEAIRDDELPYANPAYGETDAVQPNHDRFSEPHPAALSAGETDRPGDFGKSGRKAGFKFPLSKQNMRLAAMVTILGTVSFFALRSFISDPSPDTIKAAHSNSAEFNGDQPEGPNALSAIAPTVGEYEDNKIAAANLDVETISALELTANGGDALAQYQLGLSYLQSDKTEEGINLIRQAASQNQPAAQYRLAKLYERGQGVTKNLNLARELTERAALNGNRIAMHDLAIYYAEAKGGVEKDLNTAAKWFEKAAERNVVDSQFNLAVLYEQGAGVPLNPTNAYVWYAIAAKQGDAYAKENAARLSQVMNESDRNLADERVRAFKPIRIDNLANGIFTEADSVTKTTSNTQQDPVKHAQILLTKLGYDTGQSSNASDDKIRQAIIAFERSNGLQTTGRLNEGLIEKLELAVGV